MVEYVPVYIKFINLTSFPIFICYLLLIPLSRVWVKMVPKFEFKWTLVIYNIICVIISLICTVVGFKEFLSLPNTLELVVVENLLKKAFFLYWMSKLFELLDTVFMILKHNIRQISFLHIFHHSSMVLLSDYAYNVSPWAPISVVVFLNSFVHIWMYLYYAISVVKQVDPSWKRHITHLQLIQFFIGIVFSIPGYLYHGFCIYSLLYPASMIILFSNYYYAAFIKPSFKRKLDKIRD